MDLVQRLIVLLLLAVPSWAHAVAPSVKYVYQSTAYSSIVAGCQAAVAAASVGVYKYDYSIYQESSTDVACYGIRRDNQTQYIIGSLTKAKYCGSVAVGAAVTNCSTICTAPQTYDESLGQCSNPCPPAGTVEGTSANAYEASSINPTICIGEGSQGCVWKPGGTVPAVCANGKCYQWGPFTATGASCNPSSTVPGAPQSAASAPVTDAACVAKGQCPGMINGTTICVPCSSKSQESVTSTSSAASSAASGAAPSTSGESTTTGTKTQCSGPTCVTTTTTTTQKSDGSTEQKSSTKTESMTDYCAANPKAAVCKGVDESSWGGACVGGFTCKGDAVQCAQAQAAYDLSCAAKTDPNNATVQAGNAAIGAGDRPSGHPGLDPEFVDVQSTLDTTNPFGSSCPSDIQLNVVGASVSIPLSNACSVLRVLGYVAVAFSLLGAGRLVIGAV